MRGCSCANDCEPEDTAGALSRSEGRLVSVSAGLCKSTEGGVGTDGTKGGASDAVVDVDPERCHS